MRKISFGPFYDFVVYFLYIRTPQWLHHSSIILCDVPPSFSLVECANDCIHLGLIRPLLLIGSSLHSSHFLPDTLPSSTKCLWLIDLGAVYVLVIDDHATICRRSPIIRPLLKSIRGGSNQTNSIHTVRNSIGHIHIHISHSLEMNIHSPGTTRGPALDLLHRCAMSRAFTAARLPGQDGSLSAGGSGFQNYETKYV